MRHPYAYALCALATSLLLLSAVRAQPAYPSSPTAALAGKQAHLERLAAPFPHAAEALRAAATYVLTERSVYLPNDEGVLQPSAQSRFAYEDTRRVLETVYSWTDGVLVPDARTRFVYSVPLLIRREEEEWDPSTGDFRPTEQTINTYAGSQGSGLPTTVFRQVRDGDTWRTVERTFYTVAGTGLNGYYAEGETEEWTEAGMQAKTRFTVEQAGNDVLYTDQEMTSSGWVTTERTRYLGVTPVELNNRLRELARELEDFTGIFVALRLPDHITEHYENGVVVSTERHRSETTYNWPGGAITRVEVTEETLRGQTWVPSSRYVTHYNEASAAPQPLRTDLEQYDGDEWELTFREAYAYAPDSGRMSTLTWQFQGEEGLADFLRLEFAWALAGGGTSNDPEPSAGGFTLDAPYPNPTATSASLTYRLRAPGAVSVRVYDALGRRVVTLFEGEQAAGTHPVTLDTASLPGGLYFVRLEAAGTQHTRALTVAR